MSDIPKSKDELLRRWHKRLREIQTSHYEAAKPLSLFNYLLGIPVVVLTTFVGSSIFATLSKNVDDSVKILLGIASGLAAVLSAIQTFLRFSERAELHRKTASQAGTLRREIEQLLASENAESIPNERFDTIRKAIDKLAEGAPSVPNRTWEKAKRQLEN